MCEVQVCPGEPPPVVVLASESEEAAHPWSAARLSSPMAPPPTPQMEVALPVALPSSVPMPMVAEQLDAAGSARRLSDDDASEPKASGGIIRRRPATLSLDMGPSMCPSSFHGSGDSSEVEGLDERRVPRKTGGGVRRRSEGDICAPVPDSVPQTPMVCEASTSHKSERQSRCLGRSFSSLDDGDARWAVRGGDARLLGPLDYELQPRSHQRQGKDHHAVDPAAVYIRLSNFAARRKSLMLRRKVVDQMQADGIASASAAARDTTAGEFCVVRTTSELLGTRSAPSRPATPSSTFPAPAAAGRRSLFGRALEVFDAFGSTATSTRVPSVPSSPSHAAAVPITPRGCAPSTEGGLVAGASPPIQQGWLERHQSCPNPTFGDRASDADSMESEAREEIEIASIQRHLEEMNSAAADLNAAQEGLNTAMAERKKLIQLWAVGSARLARAVGHHTLGKVAPYFEHRRRCEVAQQAVEDTSRRFISTLQASDGADDIGRCREEHAARLAEFQVVQREMEKKRKKLSSAGFTEATLTAVAPYFEAEEEHRRQLAAADSEVDQWNCEASDAKARYHAALRGLEALSEQAHRRRAAANGGNGGGGEEADQLGTSPQGRDSPKGGRDREARFETPGAGEEGNPCEQAPCTRRKGRARTLFSAAASVGSGVMGRRRKKAFSSLRDAGGNAACRSPLGGPPAKRPVQVAPIASESEEDDDEADEMDDVSDSPVPCQHAGEAH